MMSRVTFGWCLVLTSIMFGRPLVLVFYADPLWLSVRCLRSRPSVCLSRSCLTMAWGTSTSRALRSSTCVSTSSRDSCRSVLSHSVSCQLSHCSHTLSTHALSAVILCCQMSYYVSCYTLSAIILYCHTQLSTVTLCQLSDCAVNCHSFQLS